MIASPATDPRAVARRKYNADYARRQRERKLAEQMRRSTHCPRKAGSGVCGCRIEDFPDGNGRIVTRCAWCERRKAGICRDCPKPVEGRLLSAIRCATCKVRARKLQIAQSQARNRDEINARARSRLRKMPKKKKAELLEYKRLYRKANPDKVRAQKQRYVAKKTPAYVEYHRRYNARPKRAQRKRDQATAAYYRDHPDRPTPVCRLCTEAIAWTPRPGGRAGRPPEICDKCCPPSVLKRRMASRVAAAARVERARTLPPAEPLKVQTPMPVRYARTGQRLCLTPDCRRVVTHRKKICSKCRQLAVEAARSALASRRGRGRRTDLEQARAA